MRILLVEDEQYLAEAIQHLLRRSGYEVDIASDGEIGLQCVRSGVYGAIILDNMLPKRSGIDILRTLRKEHNPTPVLMLSAKSETVDKIEGLEVGADDYLAKPFKTSELIARLRAITRRHSHGEDHGELSIGDSSLLSASRTLLCGDKRSSLTAKEYDLLDMLGSHAGKMIHTETLFRRAWGAGVFVEPRYVSVYISHLRSKLHDVGSSLQIKSVRGIGYTLTLGDEDVS